MIELRESGRLRNRSIEKECSKKMFEKDYLMKCLRKSVREGVSPESMSLSFSWLYVAFLWLAINLFNKPFYTKLNL